MKKLEILYYLQPSVNDGKQWCLLADSNTNMMRGLINELILYDVKFTIVLPEIESCAEIESWRELFPDWSGDAWKINQKQLAFIEREGPVDANEFRYFWNSQMTESLKEWLQTTESSQQVVWSNIPELTGNILQHVRPAKGAAYNALLINSCYFLDSPVHPKTGVNNGPVDKAINWWRQVEGAYRADIAGFCCDGNRFQFFEGVQTSHSQEIVEEITKKSAVFRFGYSESELDSIHYGNICKGAMSVIKKNLAGRKLIVFPNRITDPDYTNGHVFLEAASQLDPEKWVFYATNPGEKYITHKELEDKYPNYLRLVHGTPSREEYVAVLAMADMHASLFVEEANGGCACREAMHLRSMPLMPYANEYTRLTDADYPGYIDYSGTTVDPKDIVDAVMRLENHQFDEFQFNHEVGSFRMSAQEVIKQLSERGINLQLL
tara:strand:+ start:636 stop:1940 length:1305 start_codon:yes stop_codon:yes gene_type:complete